jgi:hypothetical protein
MRGFSMLSKNLVLVTNKLERLELRLVRNLYNRLALTNHFVPGNVKHFMGYAKVIYGLKAKQQ